MSQSTSFPDSADAQAARPDSLPAPHALYVEDNALDADLTQRALARSLPYLVLETVATVAEAIARLDAHPPRYQWVLFDLSLPDGDGLEVLRHLRARRLPAAAIAITGTGDERSVIAALKSGVDDYVIKQAGYLDTLPEVLHRAQTRFEQSWPARGEHTLAVLYVEDNPQDGELTRRHLAAHAPHLQLTLLHAPATDLLTRLHRQPPDVLLLDYHLDELDAFDLVRALQASELRHLPTVIITGQGSEDVAVQALRMGMADYLVKEGSYLQRLPAVIESAYMRSQLSRERERLRQSEAHLRHLCRQLPGTMVITRRSAQGQLEPVFATDAVCKLQGLSPHELANDAMLARTHPDDAHTLQALIDNAARTGAGGQCEYRLDVPEQGWRWFETQLTPQAQPDGSTLLYSYTFDITERKYVAELSTAARAADQANRAKTEFLSRMSHELRTPLNAVLGFAQLLLADSVDTISPRQRGQVQFIEQAGAHLVEMISDILDLSRIEAGQMTLTARPTDAVQLCHEALGMVLPSPQTPGIEVMIEPCTAASRGRVMADPLRLRQVLVNLLSNAIKYNRPGGRVTVSIGDHAPESGDTPGEVAILITDTGQGLSATQQRHLFEPFNRLGAEGSGIEGTGIGLVIVNRLVGLMGGRLSVRSEVGVGSRFGVHLPAASLDDADPDSEPAQLGRPEGAHQGRILYAEDDAINAELMRQILSTQMNVHLDVAINGKDAIAMARRHPPDLLLLDMNLGDMDGIAVSDTLRDDPRLRDIPRVALSADAMPERIQEALSHGFRDYLTKPVDVRQLVACLERHLAAN